jgi:hypothetical protein
MRLACAVFLVACAGRGTPPIAPPPATTPVVKATSPSTKCPASLLPEKLRKMSARIYFNRAAHEDSLAEKVRNWALAYCVMPHPSVAYNLGRAEAERGNYRRAIEWLSIYLVSNPPDAAEVERMMEKLQLHFEPCRGAC